MIRIFVSGHGSFASGILSAFTLILGKTAGAELYCFDFPEGDSAQQLLARMKCAISKFAGEDEILIFTDVRGGSPFHMAVSCMSDDARCRVLYGVTLGMLIETYMGRESYEDADELIDEVLKNKDHQSGCFRISDAESSCDLDDL